MRFFKSIIKSFSERYLFFLLLNYLVRSISVSSKINNYLGLSMLKDNLIRTDTMVTLSIGLLLLQSENFKMALDFTQNIAVDYTFDFLLKVADYLELKESKNEYSIRALERQWGTKAIHLHLANITEREAFHLLRVLRRNSGSPPVSVQITYDKNLLDPRLDSGIQECLTKQELRVAALSCITLQQGKRDDSSICSMLPQEMLNEIYKFTYPASADKNKMRIFVDNVSKNKPSLMSTIQGQVSP